VDLIKVFTFTQLLCEACESQGLGLHSGCWDFRRFVKSLNPIKSKIDEKLYFRSKKEDWCTKPKVVVFEIVFIFFKRHRLF
jgi:hypothetical protein